MKDAGDDGSLGKPPGAAGDLKALELNRIALVTIQRNWLGVSTRNHSRRTCGGRRRVSPR